VSPNAPLPVVTELFGVATSSNPNWKRVIAACECPFVGAKCDKTRKSDSTIAIGVCSVRRPVGQPLVICPRRLREPQIFDDCVALLDRHQPGNELRIVKEVPVIGGSVDFLLVSVSKGRAVDFVGIELQSLDTTQSVWSARQNFLGGLGLAQTERVKLGINWKMSAKTILMQIHHKVAAFEDVGRRLVLVIQTPFLEYMTANFDFGHLTEPAAPSDSVHFHSYDLQPTRKGFSLGLARTLSTSSEGVRQALNAKQMESATEEAMLDLLTSRLDGGVLYNPS
jgi:hypothetical protein